MSGFGRVRRRRALPALIALALCALALPVAALLLRLLLRALRDGPMVVTGADG